MFKRLVAAIILIAFFSCNRRERYMCVCTDDEGFEWRRTLVSGETYEEAYLQCVPSGNSDECVLE